MIAAGSMLSDEAKAALLSYSWPGNVRELKNFVMQATTLAGPGEILKEHLPANLNGNNRAIPSIAPLVSNNGSSENLDQMERVAIQQALVSTGGHQGKAAARLGISRRTLSRRLKDYRVETAEQAGPLGVLSPEQQQSFRADAEFPVTVRTSKTEVLATGTNISRRGLGLKNFDARLCGEDGAVDLSISLTNQVAIRAQGIVVWSRGDGKAGVRFTSVEPESDRHLENWIAGRIIQEGWTPQPEHGDSPEPSDNSH
jgi:regulatory Fis family protein/PilZ domain-containing protein